MINCAEESSTSSYIDIINEFRSLIDFINYKDVLIEKMFHIFRKHFDFNAAGIFFNSPDVHETNILELYVSNKNVDASTIEQKFFHAMSEYKQIYKHKVKPYNHIGTGYNNEITNELILPFMYNDNLLGGICLFSHADMFKDKIESFNLIINEFLSIFKLKYIFTEQVFKSSIDSLTGLYNRNQFDIGLQQEFNRAKRYDTPFSVAMIDIDHFKNINDKYGHQFGDYVLVEISKIIQHAFRKTDVVYRYGGEEIVIIMPATTIEHSYLPLERLRKKISMYDFKGKRVNVSIGVADYRNQNSPEEILKNADTMLYKAKEYGRNQVIIAPDKSKI